jgi:hypothetical protein
MRKTNEVANWHNLRVQINGVVLIRDTNKLAPERIMQGYRYVRVTPKSQKPFMTKVAKLVYALFGEIEVDNLSRMWDVEYRDGNPLNCNINNLRYQEHHSKKYPRELRLKLLREYKKGDRGAGYTALARKYGMMPTEVSYVVKHPSPMDLHILKKEMEEINDQSPES